MKPIDLDRAYETLVALHAMFPTSRLVVSELPRNESNESLSELSEWLQEELQSLEEAAANKDKDAVHKHLIMARSHSMSLSNLFSELVAALEQLPFAPETPEP